MKKLLTLVLAITLLFTYCYSALASETVIQSETAPTAVQEEAYEILKAIGVIDESDFTGGNIYIKRGMAAKLALRLYNITDAPQQETGFFDVPSSHAFSGYISMAKDMGIINGIGDGKFSPEGFVSYDQIIKIMVTALGRYRQAESFGGYSNGYLGAATRLGIIKRFTVNDKSKLTVYEIAPLLLDVLETEIENPLLEGDYGKETLLSRFFDIEKEKGIVNADYYISRMGESTAKADIIRINDYDVRISGYTPDLVGEKITAYVKYNSTDIPEVVWYKKNYEDSRIVIDSADITEMTTNVVKFDNDSVSKTLKISGSVVIKNGVIIPAPTDADMNVTNGTVTLVSSDTASYDTVILEEYQDTVVKTVYDEETVSIKNTFTDYDGITKNKVTVDLDSTSPKTLLVNWDGKDVTIDDFEEDDILSVAVSDKLIKIVRSERCIAGPIESIGDDFVEIDGEVIKTTFSVINTDKTLKTGLDALFSINHRGYLVWIGESEKLGKNASQYGYLVKAGIITGMKHTVQLKLFSQSGKMVVYKVADKVIFNGIKDDSMLLVSTTSPLIGSDQNVKEQLISFKLNADNEIKEISTAVYSDGMSDNERKETFTIDYVSPNETENMIGSPAYMFVSKYIVRNSTYVFTVPGHYDESNEDEYTITPVSKLEHNEQFPGLELYDIDPDSNVIGAFVDKRYTTVVSSTGALSVTGVVTGKGAMRDKDGNFINYFDIYSYKGKLVRYTLGEDLEAEFDKVITDRTQDDVAVYQNNGKDHIQVSDIDVGDIVQFESSAYDEITAISVLFRVHSPKVEEKAYDRSGNIHNERNLTAEVNYAPLLISYCPVEKVSNHGFITTVPYYYNDSQMLERIHFFGSAPILLFDTQTKEVTRITSDEIRAGEDMAFIHRENRTQRLIVVYR